MKNLLYLILLLSVSCSDQISISSNDIEKFRLPDAPENYNSPIDIKSINDAVYLGQLLFHKRTSISRVSCSDCHNANNDFYSASRLQSGGEGIYNEMMSRRSKDYPVDKMTLKSPSILNNITSENMLWGGELGTGGFNEHLPTSTLTEFKKGNTEDGVYAQVSAANHVHLMEDLTLECRYNGVMQDASKKAFDRPIDFQVVQSAIGIYEKNIISNENKVNRILRGSGEKLSSPKGMKLYLENCYDCHNKPMLSNKIANSEFQGRIRMTKDTLDYGLLKVPRLENIKSSPGYFHNDSDITLYTAIKKHNIELSTYEIYKIKSFITNDLHDPNLIRYTNYE